MEAERDQFINAVYAADAINTRKAVELLVERLDDLQNSDDFAEVDSIIAALEPSRLSDSAIVSTLGITLAARPRLTTRQAFYDLSISAVSIKRGGIEAAEKLLSRYR